MKTTPINPAAPEGYADWLKQLKTDIARAQQRAALTVNTELVQLYGRIGRDILQRQDAQGWGAKVIERLAQDLKDAFPNMRGFSSRNLKYMLAVGERCWFFSIKGRTIPSSASLRGFSFRAQNLPQ